MTRQDDVPLPCYSDDLLAGIRALECWRAAGEGRWWEIYSAPVSEGNFTAGIRDPCEDNTWFGCGATPAAAVAAVLLVIANETAP